MPSVSGSSLLSVKVSVSGRILVNLDKSILLQETGAWSAEVEDFLGLLREEVGNAARKKLKKVSGVLFAIEGRNYESFMFMPDKGLTPQGKVAPLAVPGRVVVAAGYGLYFHYKFKDWRAQRQPFYGVLEDDITPVLAETLSSLLRDRSNAEIFHVREATSSASIHRPSGQPWWRLSARYYLKKLLPNNKEIWNSFSPRYPTDPLRERKDDIRSRPLYANFLDAETLLLIHTNAGPTPNTGTGTRVYFRETDRSGSLASNVSCYMGELIHARDLYKNFRVAPPEPVPDKGELNLASMPAVLVEVAYHDNVNDAAALLDPDFRFAAMKGVEKGWRLFKQGKGCTLFAATSWPNVTVPSGTTVSDPVYFDGYPRFPVTASIRYLSCPPSATCTNRDIVFTRERTSSLPLTTWCTTGSSAELTFVKEVYLTDADGVKTNAVTTTVSCVSSSTATSAKKTGRGRIVDDVGYSSD